MLKIPQGHTIVVKWLAAGRGREIGELKKYLGKGGKTFCGVVAKSFMGGDLAKHCTPTPKQILPSVH